MSISAASTVYQGALSILSQSPETGETSQTGETTGTAGENWRRLSRRRPATAPIPARPIRPAPTSIIFNYINYLQSVQDIVSKVSQNEAADSTNASVKATIEANHKAVMSMLAQQDQKIAASEGSTATFQNANDVPGLNFDETVTHTTGPQGGQGEKVSLDFNSDVFQNSGPNGSAILFDDNPSDAQLVSW